MKKYMFVRAGCDGCINMIPIAKALNVGVEIIDIDDNQEFREKYYIAGLPTLVIDNNGDISYRFRHITKEIVEDFFKDE